MTRRAFPKFESYQGRPVELVGPGVNDGLSIEEVHCGHDAILEFMFGCHTDLAQDGSRELGKEALDEVEPRAVLGGEGEFEAAGGLIGEPGFGFLGDVRGVIVEDQLDRRMGRIGGVEKLEEFDEFAAAMAILDQRASSTGLDSIAVQRAGRR